MRQRLSSMSARRINVAESYEVTYWSKAFGVSEDDLLRAVTDTRFGVEPDTMVIDTWIAWP